MGKKQNMEIVLMKTKRKVETLEKEAFIKVMNECFAKLNKTPPISLEKLEMSLEEWEVCFDCVTDIYCAEGMNPSSGKRNAYGEELNKAITTLQMMHDSIGK